MVDNHPSGEPKRSRDGIEMTPEIKPAAEALAIAVHVVNGRKGHASFRSLGLPFWCSGESRLRTRIDTRIIGDTRLGRLLPRQDRAITFHFLAAIRDSRAARICPSSFASESTNRTCPDTPQRHGGFAGLARWFS
jgi:hypothetical protein